MHHQATPTFCCTSRLPGGAENCPVDRVKVFRHINVSSPAHRYGASYLPNFGSLPAAACSETLQKVSSAALIHEILCDVLVEHSCKNGLTRIIIEVLRTPVSTRKWSQLCLLTDVADSANPTCAIADGDPALAHNAVYSHPDCFLAGIHVPVVCSVSFILADVFRSVKPEHFNLASFCLLQYLIYEPCLLRVCC